MQASETHVHCMLFKTGIALFEYSEYVVYDAVLNADFKTQELSKFSLLCITLHLYFLIICCILTWHRYYQRYLVILL